MTIVCASLIGLIYRKDKKYFLKLFLCELAETEILPYNDCNTIF